MKILYTYIKEHKALMFFALFLAAINQSFSLYDSIIIGKLLNECAVGVLDFNGNEDLFIKAVLGWLLLSIGAAMVSRIAKNFQDYFTNIIIQRTGARMYTDGIQKALQLPYQDFEDQRSGETLGKLQKVKTDCEKIITLSISLIFQSLVGIVFVVVYAVNIHWLLGPLFLATVPVIAVISSFLGKKIKAISRMILGETTALAGATTESLRNIELVKSLGLTEQEVKRLNETTIKVLGLELKKIRFIRSLSFIQGTTVHLLRTCLIFALYLFIFRGIIKPGDMITLMFFSFFLFNPLQELGNVIATYNDTKASMDNFSTLMNAKSEEKPVNPKTMGAIQNLRFSNISFKSAEGNQAEAHRKHIDIQYLVKGKELMGHTTLYNQTESKSYNDNDDYALYNEEYSFIKVNSGEFTVFFPHDIHMPCIKVNKEELVKKIVIKIKL